MSIEYIDISQAPIFKGDLIEYPDKGQKEVYIFRVLNLEQTTDTTRVFKVKVIKSSGSLKIGDEHIITIPKNEVTDGYVFKEKLQDGKTTYRGVITGIEDIVISELKAYLDSKVLHNYSASWKEVTQYFKSTGIGPIADMETSIEVSKYLRRIVKGHKSFFNSDGGWVRSLKPSESLGPSNVTNLTREIKEVDIAKVNAGIKLLLESGLFGRIRLRNE